MQNSIANTYDVYVYQTDRTVLVNMKLCWNLGFGIVFQLGVFYLHDKHRI